MLISRGKRKKRKGNVQSWGGCLLTSVTGERSPESADSARQRPEEDDQQATASWSHHGPAAKWWFSTNTDQWWSVRGRLRAKWMVSSTALIKHQPMTLIRKCFPSRGSLYLRFIFQVHLLSPPASCGVQCRSSLPPQVNNMCGAAFDWDFLQDFSFNMGCIFTH